MTRNPIEQRDILTDGTRNDVIEWLEWNDHNGCYNDADCEAEDMDPLTLDDARDIMRKQLLENSEPGVFFACEHCDGKGVLNGCSCPNCGGVALFTADDFEPY